MSVYESKGLEFTSVVVVEKGMTDSEKYIAYTRALNELAFIKE
jgi:DNA helicase IV